MRFRRKYLLFLASAAVALSIPRLLPAEPSASPDKPTPASMELFLWHDVPKFASENEVKPELLPPIAAYADIWQPQWQKELGISAEQKAKLTEIHARAMAEQKVIAERFKKLSPSEQAARTKALAGKPGPEWQKHEHNIRAQIEAVLTEQQIRTLKDYILPSLVVVMLHDAATCRRIGFTADQQNSLHRITEDRKARFQQLGLEKADKQWALLTPAQQAAMPEVVKHQGPTSAVLSIAWEIGFDFDHWIPAFPMLAEEPVRRRLGLSDEQTKKLEQLMEATAQRNRERRAGKTAAPAMTNTSEEESKKQVQAILTAEQLQALAAIDFRRRVVLALGYPEKRKSVGITAAQEQQFHQLAEEHGRQMYRADRELREQVVKLLTAGQLTRLKAKIDAQ